MRYVLVGVAVALIVAAAAVVGYVSNARAQGSAQTITASAYSIEIKPLNRSMEATAGSSVLLLFNVTSPVTGALYFYARTIPLPGSQETFNIQNVTTGNVQLPPGVSVSYPTGQAVFGTNHDVLALRVEFSPAVNGTVGLVVGAFQQVNQDQVVGTGSGVYITALQP